MPIQKTSGTIRASKGYAIFRILFGLFFIGLGINQYSRLPESGLPYFSLGIGVLFVGYGVWALLATRTLGSKIDLETEMPSATERLAEITRLRDGGLITAQEFEAKRQEILKDL